MYVVAIPVVVDAATAAATCTSAEPSALVPESSALRESTMADALSDISSFRCPKTEKVRESGQEIDWFSKTVDSSSPSHKFRFRRERVGKGRIEVNVSDKSRPQKVNLRTQAHTQKSAWGKNCMNSQLTQPFFEDLFIQASFNNDGKVKPGQ